MHQKSVWYLKVRERERERERERKRIASKGSYRNGTQEIPPRYIEESYGKKQTNLRGNIGLYYYYISILLVSKKRKFSLFYFQKKSEKKTFFENKTKKTNKPKS